MDSQSETDTFSKNTWIGKISRELVQKLVTEIRKPEHAVIVEEHVLQPLIQHTFQKLYPYIIATSIIFFLTFILAVAILFVVMRSHP